MAMLKALAESPRYALVRGLARFGAVRHIVTRLTSVVGAVNARRREKELAARLHTTLFPNVDRHGFLSELRQRGCSFGLQLPRGIVEEMLCHAESQPAFAFRDESLGFMPHERQRAEALLGKEILLAQYFNVERECRAVCEIAADPLLNWIALHYLGSMPHFTGCNLWWTYPVKANRVDQLKHAHFFHRDVDDFKFVKFFFYLTDVEPGDGAHWLVSGSHRKPPHIRLKDRFVLRRFEDKEIESFYERRDILEVVGPKGSGFAEDTLCVHKAATPSRRPRLLLHLQFALFDLGVGNDSRDSTALRMISSIGPVTTPERVALG